MRRRIRKWPHIMKSSNALHVVFHVRKQGEVPSEIQRKSVWAGGKPDRPANSEDSALRETADSASTAWQARLDIIGIIFLTNMGYC